MTQLDYNEVLLKGLVSYNDHLEKYLIRESKKAEKEYIDNEEFFSGLLKTIELFDSEINVQYIDRLDKVDTLRDIKLAKGEAIDDLEAQEFPKKTFKVNLHYFTNGKFSGHLTYQNIRYLEATVKIAQDMLLENAKKEHSAKLLENGLISYNPTDTRILDEETIKKLYEFCNDNKFFNGVIGHSDFFNCFNIDKEISVYPKFNHSFQQKFVFLINELILTKLTNILAKKRFKIIDYSGIVNRALHDNRASVLKEKMKEFINKYKSGISNK